MLSILSISCMYIFTIMLYYIDCSKLYHAKELYHVVLFQLYYIVFTAVSASLGTGKPHLTPTKQIFDKCLVREFLIVQIKTFYKSPFW